MELEIEKKEGDFTGWIGYTLAWVKRSGFPGINNGGEFPTRFDTRHNLSVVGLYRLNRRWSFTGTWVYQSGYITWFPLGRFSVSGVPGTPSQVLVPDYGNRNNFRYPAYTRFDLGVVCKFFPRWGESDLTLSVYNASDRRNPYFIYIEPDVQTITVGNTQTQFLKGLQPKQVSLFPVLPSVTWNFKF